MSLLASGVLANPDTAYFGGGGGGGGSVVLNNGKLGVFSSGTFTLQPNVPLQLASISINADYTNGPNTIYPIAQSQLVDLQVSNTNVVTTTGDTLTFYVSAVQGANPPQIITPAVVYPYAQFTKDTTVQPQINPQGYTGSPVSNTANSYTVSLYALYGTSNSTPIIFNRTGYSFNCQVLACPLG